MKKVKCHKCKHCEIIERWTCKAYVKCKHRNNDEIPYYCKYFEKKIKNKEK